jgi:hypothetical protein
MYLNGTVIDTKIRGLYYYDRKTKYYSSEKSIINEAHIYLNPEYMKLQPGDIQIPLKDITEIRILDKNKNKTIVSYFTGTISTISGISATLFVFLLLVIILF